MRTERDAQPELAGPGRTEAKADGFLRRLPSIRKRFPGLSDDEIRQWSVLDPTTRHNYTEWIVKVALCTGVVFEPSAVIHLRVKNALTSAMMWKIDVPRHFNSFEEIDDFQQNGDGWHALKAREQGKQATFRKAIHGTSVVWEGDGSYVLRVEQAAALKRLAAGTEWCVRSDKAAARYLANGPLYYIATLSDVYLADPWSGQLKGSDDEEVGGDFAETLIVPLKGANLAPSREAGRGWSTVIALQGDAEAMLRHIPRHSAEEVLFLEKGSKSLTATAVRTLQSIAGGCGR